MKEFKRSNGRVKSVFGKLTLIRNGDEWEGTGYASRMTATAFQ